jgi:DNA-directed RNA polymerase subunit N (RpoN/RPB10)
MSAELPSVRCQTCGKPITSRTLNVYWDGLQEGLDIKDAVKRTGIQTSKFCCVMTIRAAIPPWSHPPEQHIDYRVSDFYTYIKPTQTVRHLSTK